MFTCPSCKKTLAVFTPSDVTRHLNQHKEWGQLNFPIRCRQANCKSALENTRNFGRHFETFHFNDLDYVAQPEPLDRIELDNNDDRDEPAHPVLDDVPDETVLFDMETDCLENDFQSKSFAENISSLKETVKTLAMNMLIDMRSKGNIPFKVSTKVMGFVKGLVDLFADKVNLAIQSEFGKIIEDADELKKKLIDVSESMQSLKSLLPPLATEYQIRKLYEQHPLFVSPQPVVLGYRNEFKRKVDNGIVTQDIVSVPNKAQYVSIESTILAILNDPDMLELIKKNNEEICADGVYTCFQSGARFKSNPFWNDKSKIVIAIQLFFDGLGITNALRNVATLHNSGMFYFTILNLPPRFNAAVSNIHLVAMCNSLDIKETNGLNTLLEKIVCEISRLEKEGLDVETSSGKIKVYCSLAQFTGDNLGVHQILGLIECFSADFCCILCYATRDEMQQLEREDGCQLRTKADYDFDVAQLDDLPTGRNHFRGIKTKCCLNDLGHFHITDNWLNDAMHSVLEGVIPYVTGAILFKLSEFNPRVTIELINQRLIFLFDSLIVDKQNKPCLLSRLLPPGQEMSPKQTAAQQYALFRYLPLILSDEVENEQSFPYWDLFLNLQEVVDIIFSLKHTDSLLTYLSELIQQFLALFKAIFPALPVRPKMHYLIHYPSIIRKNGPMRNYWCMAYERANGVVKLPSHIMGNFRDPQRTLAYRRQCAALHSLLERKGNRNWVTVKKPVDISANDLEGSLNFDHLLESLLDSDSVSISECVTVNGVEFREGTFVVTGVQELGFYSFGRIEYCVCENLDDIFILTTSYDTLDFDHHSFSYLVKQRNPIEQKLVPVADLLDPFPLDMVVKNDKSLIRLKHYVLKS